MRSSPPDSARWNRLFDPRAVAIVGAHPDPSRYGGAVLRYIRESGFSGDVHPVNPKYAEIQGLVSYPTVADLPPDVDALIALVAPHRIAEVLAEAGRQNIAFAVVPGSGGGPDGESDRNWERFLGDLARSSGVRVIGPNCVGLLSPTHGMNLAISTALRMGPPRAGGVAVVSQTGGLLGGVLSLGDAYGVGFSHLISTGGEADLSAVDFIEYLVDDAATTVICGLLEGISDIPRFVALARRARSSGKSVVLLKLGRSVAGAQAAMSHSGRLSPGSTIHASVMAAAGVVQVSTVEEMLASALALSCYPAGASQPTIALTSRSGGACSYLADRLADAGLQLASLSDATVSALRGLVGREATTNPIDLGGGVTTAADAPSMVTQALDLLADDDSVGIRVFADAVLLPMREVSRSAAAAGQNRSAPVLVGWFAGAVADESVSELRNSQVPDFRRADDLLSAARALGIRGRQLRERAELVAPRALGEIHATLAGSGSWNDHVALRVLELAGMTITPMRLAGDVAELADQADLLEFPVALKLLIPSITHKSDLGAVRLDLSDPDELLAAAKDMLAVVGSANSNARSDGLLVQEMAQAGVELAFGSVTDPDYGTVVSVGFGGVNIEVDPDIVHRPGPLSVEDAEEMLGELRGAARLRGWRGAPKIRIDLLARELATFSQLAVAIADVCGSIDVNPVIASADSVVAVDALLVSHT